MKNITLSNYLKLRLNVWIQVSSNFEQAGSYKSLLIVLKECYLVQGLLLLQILSQFFVVFCFSFVIFKDKLRFYQLLVPAFATQYNGIASISCWFSDHLQITVYTLHIPFFQSNSNSSWLLILDWLFPLK